jgi:thymidylate synthase (FAD)
MKVDELGYTILTDDWADMLGRIERAARNCYKSEEHMKIDSAQGMVEMLLRKGHEAMIEHGANISVLFHVPRGLTHEFVRHRLASFAQESTRYCNYAKDRHGNEITVIPMMNDLTIEQVERRLRLWQHIEDVYMAEIDEGVKPQQARDNLPICIKSDIIITTNIRHWREIFRQRAEKHAHPQMQWIMKRLLADFRSRVPVLFDDVGSID